MDYNQESLKLHSEHRGKISICPKVPLNNHDDLAVAYTPGVAEPCRQIAADPSKVWEYTNRANTVAIVTDGSAVLGLGNIGPSAALPVMEGKAVIFKLFADVDAFPICLATQDTEEIIAVVKALAPTFGGINLEDISAPRCFEIERRLQADLDIPVFHDDQHGTAVVVLAGLINAMRVTDRQVSDLKVVVSGAGAAGIAITRMLLAYGISNIMMVDSHGIISDDREDLNPTKQELAKQTNPASRTGSLSDALVDANVFIGVSAPSIADRAMIARMEKGPIVFALSNPTPEIMPEEALAAGAAVIATGRSDFQNQVNNALVFPGMFRGALDARAKTITEAMKLAAAKALADQVENPTAEMIIPDALDHGATEAVAKAVRAAAK